MAIRKMWWMFALAFFGVGLAFLTQNMGINGDEGGYLACALSNPFCDSASTGKPVFFYAMNYLLMHKVGDELGSYRVLSLYLFYFTFFALAVMSYGYNRRMNLLQMLCLLCLPLVVYNQPLLMMENMLLTLLLFSSVAMKRGPILFLMGFIGGLIKVTFLPAYFLLLWWKRNLRDAIIFSGLLAIAVVAINKMVLKKILVGPGDHFFIMERLLNESWRKKTFDIAIETWWSFTLPLWPLLIDALTRYKEVLKDWKGWLKEAMLIGFALIGSCLICAVSFSFPRYFFPLLFLACLIILERTLPRARSIVVVASLCISLFMVANSRLKDDAWRFKLWPEYLMTEMTQSGGTTFQKVPIWWIFFSNTLMRKKICLFANYKEFGHNYYLHRDTAPLPLEMELYDISQFGEVNCKRGKPLVIRRVFYTPRLQAAGVDPNLFECPRKPLQLKKRYVVDTPVRMNYPTEIEGPNAKDVYCFY